MVNPHMLRCWPALLTATSWQRCQWRNARWPEHALADSRFEQPPPGLGRSVHHSQSVKGGGASSPVSNVSIPSWCHRNHPSTTPPALGRWTCCRQGCFWMAAGLSCLGVEVPGAILPSPPGPTPPDVLATWVRCSSALCGHNGRELLCFRRAFAICRQGHQASHVQLSLRSYGSRWVSGCARH